MDPLLMDFSCTSSYIELKQFDIKISGIQSAGWLDIDSHES
jgi:hypothetical protein